MTDTLKVLVNRNNTSHTQADYIQMSFKKIYKEIDTIKKALQIEQVGNRGVLDEMRSKLGKLENELGSTINKFGKPNNESNKGTREFECIRERLHGMEGSIIEVIEASCRDDPNEHEIRDLKNDFYDLQDRFERYNREFEAFREETEERLDNLLTGIKIPMNSIRLINPEAPEADNTGRILDMIDSNAERTVRIEEVVSKLDKKVTIITNEIKKHIEEVRDGFLGVYESINRQSRMSDKQFNESIRRLNTYVDEIDETFESVFRDIIQLQNKN